VEVHDVRQVILRHEVDLVDDQARRDVLRGRPDEQAVEEPGVEGGPLHGLYAPDAVDVGHEDVLLALPGPCGPSAQLVRPLVDVRDEAGLVLVGHPERYSIPDGNRVGDVLSGQPKLAPHARGNGPVPDLHVVPAAG
jgi:hypothetical protein